MSTVLIAIGFFVLAALLHLLLCRASGQKNLKTKPFLMMAVINLLIFCLVASANHWPLILTSVAIYVLLVPVYLVFYVSTELVSPSKKILQVIAKGPCSYEDIYKVLEGENFIRLRLKELLQSRCLRRKQEHFTLTQAGQTIAKALRFYQQLLRREVGG